MPAAPDHATTIVYRGRCARVEVTGDMVRLALSPPTLRLSAAESLTYREAWALGLAIVKAADMAWRAAYTEEQAEKG